MIVPRQHFRRQRRMPVQGFKRAAAAIQAASQRIQPRRLFLIVSMTLLGFVLAPASASSDGSSCLLLEAAASKICAARVACEPHKAELEVLTDAFCGCLRGQEPSPKAEIAIRDALSAGTTTFACCAGNAISRRPDLCENRG